MNKEAVMSDKWLVTGRTVMSGKWLAMSVLSLSLITYHSSLFAQAPATTTVQDTVYKSDGSLASGSIVISWSPFLTADSKPVFGGTKTVTLTNGALGVALTPNNGATPSGTSYTVRFFQSVGVFL